MHVNNQALPNMSYYFSFSMVAGAHDACASWMQRGKEGFMHFCSLPTGSWALYKAAYAHVLMDKSGRSSETWDKHYLPPFQRTVSLNLSLKLQSACLGSHSTCSLLLLKETAA